jgi:hypothetical protein
VHDAANYPPLYGPALMCKDAAIAKTAALTDNRQSTALTWLRRHREFAGAVDWPPKLPNMCQ